MEDNITQIVKEVRSEFRKQRISTWIWRILIFLLIILFISAISSNSNKDEIINKEAFIAVVKIEGIIIAGDRNSSEKINKSLRKAFNNKGTKAVFLQINSPGGSPVQSGQIYREILRLKKNKNIPVYAFISDLGASGAYYVAAASDKIYADPSSIVGSIGVITQGIGYGELFNKIGLEDRTFTAGEHKAFLNPSQPLNETEKQHLQKILNDLHKQFIDAVVAGRSNKIDKNNQELFSGYFWSGAQALQLGLVDGNDDMEDVIDKNFKGLQLVNFSPSRGIWEELMTSTSAKMQSLAGWRFSFGK